MKCGRFVCCFGINGVDIISSEKQPKTFSPYEVVLKKTISQQMFDGMKCFTIICTFLIVIYTGYNIGT